MQKSRLLSQAVSSMKYLKKSDIQPQIHNSRRTATIATNKDSCFDSTALANAKPFEELPSFKVLPVIGTAWIYFPIIGFYKATELIKNMFDKRRRLGDISREKIGPMNIVFSFNADDMQVIFQHEGPYPIRPETMSLKAYRESRKDWYATTGLILLQGKEWWDLRSKTQKHLMKTKAVQAYLHPMQDVARDFVNKIYLTRDVNNEVPNFLQELYKWSLESVALVGLDTRLGCFDLNLAADSDGMKMITAVQTMFDRMTELESITGNIPFWKWFPTPTWKKFEKAGDVFTGIASKYINRSLEELKKNAANDDKDMTLLQSMIMTKGLDLSGALVTVTDMLMAGIDTTSHSVGFFLYNMARNPEKQEILYNEITRLLPRKEDRITPQIFNELKYLKACMKESMRLFPVVLGVGRVSDHDIVLSGYRIPAGTLMAVGLQVIDVDEKYFPNPNQYLPERWLQKHENFHRFSFLPFGFGTRSCIGRRLAELEIISLTTEVLRNFKVEYHHEDIGIGARMINTPDKPLRFNFIER